MMPNTVHEYKAREMSKASSVDVGRWVDVNWNRVGYGSSSQGPLAAATVRHKQTQRCCTFTFTLHFVRYS